MTISVPFLVRLLLLPALVVGVYAQEPVYFEALSPGTAPSWVQHLNGMNQGERQQRIRNYQAPPPRPAWPMPAHMQARQAPMQPQFHEAPPAPRPRPANFSATREEGNFPQHMPRGYNAQLVRRSAPATSAMPAWATPARAVPVAYQPKPSPVAMSTAYQPKPSPVKRLAPPRRVVHPAYGFVEPWAPYASEAEFRAAYQRVAWQPPAREPARAFPKMATPKWRLPWAKRDSSAEPTPRKAKASKSWRSSSPKKSSAKSKATRSHSSTATLPSIDGDFSGPMIDSSLFP